MKFQLNRSSWMLIGAALAAVTLYGSLGYLPARRNIAKLEEQLARIREQSSVVASGSSANPVLERLEFANRFQKEFEQRIPTLGLIPQVMGSVDALARQAGATVTKLSPTGEVQRRCLRQSSADFTCTGTFDQLGELLAALDAHDRLIWVDGAKLRATGADAQILECELKLVFFADQSEISD